MNILRSIGAVLAGVLVIALLSTLTDTLIQTINHGEYPQLWLAFLYRSIFTVLGGYITASISRQQPMRQVTILGAIGIVACAAGFFTHRDLGIHWYPFALTITAFPLCWFGGKLKQPEHKTITV